jgi:hypothetical protein
MKTPSHTPGPWRVVLESVDPEWAVVTTQGGRIVTNVNLEGGITDAGKPAIMPRDANARLIAAAPDLLAVLRYIEGRLPAHDTKSIAQARAAIRKATEPAP